MRQDLHQTCNGGMLPSSTGCVAQEHLSFNLPHIFDCDVAEEPIMEPINYLLVTMLKKHSSPFPCSEHCVRTLYAT